MQYAMFLLTESLEALPAPDVEPPAEDLSEEMASSSTSIYGSGEIFGNDGFRRRSGIQLNSPRFSGNSGLSFDCRMKSLHLTLTQTLSSGWTLETQSLHLLSLTRTLPHWLSLSPTRPH
ncbi:hypothetical protein EYF80_007920 [Liparis tanakae]|uniref:Uncharacterized protein n=1 Tax=Liparis tanakae TaxID=230148 RepID=A0A4Z2IVD7_9TELE|nr:hypothetical protein EYF80_007920 [Liparis tanakae]